MRHLIQQGKRLTGRALAAYATYEAGKKTFDKIANQQFHQWTRDFDYVSAETIAAIEAELVKGLPPFVRVPQRNRGDLGVESRLPNTWTTISLPGARFAQVERDGCYLRLRAPLASTLDALIERVTEIEAETAAARPEIEFDPFAIAATLAVNTWNGTDWVRGRQRATRTFDSVVLPADLQEAIQDDLKRFTDSRERLQRLEVPWRRGYLLSGPPGTGKTSVSLAIAASLGFDVARLSLAQVKDDAELDRAVGSLRNRAVLVIEDIDAYSVSHERDHKASRDGGLSLSGLLNALDGFDTPDGLVTIVTTNHAQRLDPALVRPGRLDRSFTLDHIAAAELDRLFRWFYEMDPPTPAPAHTRSAGLSPAQVAETFKQHLDAPQNGWEAVLNLIPTPTQQGAALRVA